MDVDALRRELARDEGLRLKPYRDSVGKLTIGYGRNLDDVGITEEEAQFLLLNDIGRAMLDLDRTLPWWQGLDAVRQRVLVNMAFNMGVDGNPKNPTDALTGFRLTLALVKAGRYEEASRRMLQSKWARQVGPRARRLSEMMRTGKEPA